MNILQSLAHRARAAHHEEELERAAQERALIEAQQRQRDLQIAAATASARDYMKRTFNVEIHNAIGVDLGNLHQVTKLKFEVDSIRFIFHVDVHNSNPVPPRLFACIAENTVPVATLAQLGAALDHPTRASKDAPCDD